MAESIEHERELREQWEESHEALHQVENDARRLASDDINRRLGEMNEFRDQLSRERGEYLGRRDYEREHNALAERVKELEIARGEQNGKAAAYASLAAFIGMAMAIIVHFWK